MKSFSETDWGREPELKVQRVFLICVVDTTTSDPIASLGYLSGLWSADQNWENYANLFLLFQMRYVWFLAQQLNQNVIKDSEGLMF